MLRLFEIGLRPTLFCVVMFASAGAASAQEAGRTVFKGRGVVATRVEFPAWRPSPVSAGFQVRADSSATFHYVPIVASESEPKLRNYMLLGALGGAVAGGALMGIGVATSCEDDCMLVGAAIGAGVVLGALVGSLVGAVAWGMTPETR